MSYPARGPASGGIDGKANAAERRLDHAEHSRNGSEALRMILLGIFATAMEDVAA